MGGNTHHIGDDLVVSFGFFLRGGGGLDNKEMIKGSKGSRLSEDSEIKLT